MCIRDRMAPLCEEVLARGVIQRAYESFGPRRAILYVGGLFVIFHLSLLQGLGIIPLALALGYVYWRSQSLVASILAHFGANAMAALVLTLKKTTLPARISSMPTRGGRKPRTVGHKAGSVWSA